MRLALAIAVALVGINPCAAPSKTARSHVQHAVNVAPLARSTLTGQARVLDGDTLEVSGQIIRLLDMMRPSWRRRARAVRAPHAIVARPLPTRWEGRLVVRPCSACQPSETLMTGCSRIAASTASTSPPGLQRLAGHGRSCGTRIGFCQRNRRHVPRNLGLGPPTTFRRLGKTARAAGAWQHKQRPTAAPSKGTSPRAVRRSTTWHGTGSSTIAQRSARARASVGSVARRRRSPRDDEHRCGSRRSPASAASDTRNIPWGVARKAQCPNDDAQFRGGYTSTGLARILRRTNL